MKQIILTLKHLKSIT